MPFNPIFNYTIFERCLWQGYGLFLIVWGFIVPLIIFVVAYWKILAVIRRQMKVTARLTGASNEPVAGPSRGTAAAETTNAVLSKDESQRDEMVEKGAVMSDPSKPARAGNQLGSTGLSKAQMNVVRTMIYITVCFTLCWLPMRTIVMIKRFSVSQVKYLLSVKLN